MVLPTPTLHVDVKNEVRTIISIVIFHAVKHPHHQIRNCLIEQIRKDKEKL